MGGIVVQLDVAALPVCVAMVVLEKVVAVPASSGFAAMKSANKALIESVGGVENASSDSGLVDA